MPHHLWLIPLGILIPVAFITPILGVLRGMLCAVLVVLAHGSLYQQRIHVVFDGSQDITITGQIDSFFKPLSHGYQTSFVVQQRNQRSIPWIYSPTLRVIWPQEPESEPQTPLPAIGEQWQLQVKLKPVLGRLNIAGFDKEKHFVTQRWHGVAVVTGAQPISRDASMRGQFRQQVFEQTITLPRQGYLLALSFGDRSHLAQSDWLKLRNSGLIHLLAISGLHVGMAFALGWWVARGLTFMPWSSWAPLIGGISLAFCYAWLAGFSLPTQRALLMCAVLAGSTMLGLHFNPWKILLICLCLMLLMDPFSVMSVGFWLSYGAVAVIYLFLRANDGGVSSWRAKLMQLVKLQFWLLVGLLPMSVYVFQGTSVLSPLFNLMFVPWVSVVCLPLIVLALLMTLIAPDVSGVFWRLADGALLPVSYAIEYANWGWQALAQDWALLGMVPLSVLMVYRLLTAVQLFSVATLIIAAVWPRLPPSGWVFNLLDVGHGLAVLIEKDGRAILYDTGLAWPQGSYAQSVIEPVLLAKGITRLDGMILSHLDSDHAGGRGHMESKFSPKWLRASQHLPHYQSCKKGDNWRWQGLDFEVLWPPKLVKRAYNPHSCVVMVSDGYSKVLLTGDIDAISEMILAREKQKLKADIMLVPHHGSASSSKGIFVGQVKPKWALASLALDNQWGMPAPQVLDQYRSQQINWMDTGQYGQIMVHFNDGAMQISSARSELSPRWYRQIVRNRVE